MGLQTDKILPPGIWDNPQPEDMQAYDEFTYAYLADDSQYNKFYTDYLNQNSDDVLLRSLSYNYTETVGGGIKVNGSAQQKLYNYVELSGGIKLNGSSNNTFTIDPNGGISVGGASTVIGMIYYEEGNWKPVHIYPVYFDHDPDIWSYEWKCPIDVCQIEVYCLGAGAGGDGGETSDRGGNGGGGGAFARAIRPVVPDLIYTIYCGGGGDGGGPNAQGENGGGSGFASYPAAAGGGTFLGDNGDGGYANSYGDVVHRGGNGGVGDLLTSVGGGGGAAGTPSYDGSNGQNGSDGGGGGDATTGGDGGTYAANGQAGGSGAGGGGGGGSDIMATPGTGGKGGDGFVTILDYTIFELAVRLGGSADEYLTESQSTSYYEEMSGGIKSNGTATSYVKYNIPVSGGIKSNGTAANSIIFVSSTSSGIKLNGTAVQTFYDIAETSGGIKLNGTAYSPFNDIIEVSGGIKLNGTAVQTFYDIAETSGGIKLNNTAVQTFYDIIETSGGISLNGTTTIATTYNISVSGSAKLNGTAQPLGTYNLTVSGSAKLNGTATPLATYNLTVSGSAKLNGTVAQTLYDIAETSGGIKLNGTAVQNLYDIAETSGGIKLNGTAVHNCNYFIGISGGIILNGNAIQKLHDIVQTSGGISLNGTAVNKLYSINYAFGGIGLGGISYYPSSDMIDVFGGIYVNAAATTTFYDTESMSGGIIFNGSATNSVRHSVPVSGGISLSGSAFRAIYRYESTSGGIKLNNSAINMHIMTNTPNGGLLSSGTISSTSRYETIISGSILAGGLTSISNAQDEIMSGGIKLNNSAYHLHIMTNFVEGGLATSGSLSSTFNCFVYMIGGIKTSGLTKPSNAQDTEMSGGIILSNSADYFQIHNLVMTEGMLLQGSSTTTLIDQAETFGGVKGIGYSKSDLSGLFEEDMSGGIKLSGNSIIKATYNIDAAIGQWLEGWLYRKRITPHNIPATLNQFTMLIEFSDADVGQYAQANGYDIRFTSSSGTILPFELTSFEIADGIAHGRFWVKTDLVPNSTFIYMYYGGSSLNNFTSTNAWNDDFVGVWHLDELTTMSDSTKNGNNAIGQPAPRSNGVDNYAQNYDGQHDYYVSAPVINPNSLSFTYRCWVYVENDALDHSYPLWSGAHGSDDPEHELITGYNISLGSTPWQAVICDGNTYLTVDFSDQPIKNTWLYLSVVIDRTTHQLKSYVNDTLIDTTAIGTSGPPRTQFGPLGGGGGGTFGQINGTNPLTFGAININGGRYNLFNGLVDEVRISQVALTQEWINFEYLNISRFDNNVSWSSQELPYVSTVANGGSTLTSYFLEEPSGGISLGGTATQTHYMYAEPTSGISINGESTNYFFYNVETSGGIYPSNNADIQWIAGLVIEGGISLSGNAEITYFDMYDMSGGISVSGQTIFTHNIIAEGGITNSGSHRISSYFADNMASYGGVYNESTCYPELTYNPFLSGSILFEGRSDTFYITEAGTAGGILADSTSPVIHIQWPIIGDGIKLSGESHRINIMNVIEQSSGILPSGTAESMAHKVMLGGIKMSGSAAQIHAGQRYWVGTGVNTDWDDINNWSLSSGGPPGAPLPTSELDVFFDGNGLGDCSLNTNRAFANNIEISESYTGAFSAFRNSVNVTGNATLSGTTINMGSGIWTVGGDFDISLANNVNCETSILHMTGSNKQIVASGFRLFDLVIDNGSIIDCDSMVIDNRLDVYGTLNVNDIVSFDVGADAKIYSTGTVSGNSYLEFLDGSIGLTTYAGNLLIGIRLYDGPTIVPGTYPEYVMFTNTGTNTLYCGFYTFADLRLQSVGGNKTINVKTNNMSVVDLTISSTDMLTINNKSDWNISGNVSVSGQSV